MLWHEKQNGSRPKIIGFAIVLGNGNPNDDVTSPLLGAYSGDFKEYINMQKEVRHFQVELETFINGMGGKWTGHCFGLALLDSNMKSVIKDDDTEWKVKSCISIANDEKIIGLHGKYHT